MPYIRKTVDEWEIQGNNGYGWECETTETSRKDALTQVKCYRENVAYPMRIVKKRVPIQKWQQLKARDRARL